MRLAILSLVFALTAAAADFPVDSSRALGVLADELEKRYPIVVTYEDCPWPALRTTAITFTHAPAEDVAVYDLLTALLSQYPEAEYRVEGGSGRYHLIPVQMKDAQGAWQSVTPVLDTPIRLADEERTVDATLDEIMAQLNLANGNSVGWGFTPLNLFNQTRIRMSANGAPAREVLRQILERLPRRITWRLNYDPTIRRHILNILVR